MPGIDNVEVTEPTAEVAVPENPAPLPSVTVAVLNYGRPDEAVRTIGSILASDYPAERLRPLLLDNSSPDDSVARIEERFGDRVEIVRNHPNIGPVARNRAILSGSSDYVVMLDEDCYPEEGDTIRRAITFLEEQTGFGALCFCCVNRKSGKVEFGHPGTAFRERREDGTYDGVYVIGGGMVFRSSAMEGLQGYDERLRFGGEEYDLAMELLRAGVSIAFRPDIRILHDEPERAEPPIRAWELDIRNNIWISFRRFPLILAPAIALLHVLRRLLSSLSAADSIRLRGYLRGIRSGLARLPEFIATRRAVPFRTLLSYRHWTLQMFLSRPLFQHRVKSEEAGNIDRS